MTNLQLLLTIGIPSILVVLTWLSNNQRFNAIDQRFNAVDHRFDQMEREFDKVDALLARQEDRLDEHAQRLSYYDGKKEGERTRP